MLFEVSGKEKRAILANVVNSSDLPAARARSLGETVWLVDSDALPELPRDA
jgi:6-phosphogluconolactonase